MSAKAGKKKNGKAPPTNGTPTPIDEQEVGLWIDTALISRLHGVKSSPLRTEMSGEAQRLLHYADVLLGTDKKEKFVSAKPQKERTK